MKIPDHVFNAINSRKDKAGAVVFVAVFSTGLQAQNENLNQTKLDIDSIKKASAHLVNEGKIQKAIDTLEFALKLSKTNDHVEDSQLFGLYVDLSNLYGHGSIRNNLKTEEYVEIAKRLIENGNVKTYVDVINFYVSAGANDFEMGKFQEALGYLTKAMDFYKENEAELFQEIGSVDAKALQLNLLEWPVTIYSKMGLETEMLAAYEALEKSFTKHENLPVAQEYYSLANFRLGRFYQADEVGKAVTFFDRAEKYGDKNVQLYSLICKGFAYLSAKEYEEIPAILKKLNGFKDLNKFQKLNIHEIAGRLYSEKNDIDNLVFHTNEALLLLNKKNIPLDVLDFKPEDFAPIDELKFPVLLNQFAQFIEAVDSEVLDKTAIELYKIGLNQFNERIERSPLNNHKLNYEIIKNRMLQYMSTHNISLTEKERYLSQFENIQNRANLNAIRANRTIARDSSQLDVLIANEQKLIEEITDLKLKQQQKDTIYRSEIARLELDLQEIQTKIKAENPAIYNLNNAQFSFNQLKLKQNESIVLFDVADNELYRTVITPANIEVIKIQDFPVIEQEIEQFLMLVKNKGDLTELNDLSNALSDKLMGNMALKPVLKIKADKALLNFPFEVLIKEDEYLIQKSTISYIRGLAYLSSKIQESDRRLAFNASFYAPSYSSYVPLDTELAVRGEAYDLEGAKEEVNQLAAIVNGEIFENERASKTNFLKTSNSSSIIHIAGHAFLNNGDPSLSNIVFSDDLEDNKLFISELYGLRSNADLAVLSACNTGVGGFDSGNGIISLSDAFLYSGVPSTVSSLWSAPDQSTKDIMVAFYSYLKEGEPKSKALQLAKIDYLKNVQSEKLQHPFYWSAFVLYGNDAPLDIIIENHDGSYKWWLLVVGVVVLLFLTWIVFRKKSKIQ